MADTPNTATLTNTAVVAVQIASMKQMVDAAFRAIQAERSRPGKRKP